LSDEINDRGHDRWICKQSIVAETTRDQQLRARQHMSRSRRFDDRHLAVVLVVDQQDRQGKQRGDPLDVEVGGRLADLALDRRYEGIGAAPRQFQRAGEAAQDALEGAGRRDERDPGDAAALGDGVEAGRRAQRVADKGVHWTECAQRLVDRPREAGRRGLGSA